MQTVRTLFTTQLTLVQSKSSVSLAQFQLKCSACLNSTSLEHILRQSRASLVVIKVLQRKDLIAFKEYHWNRKFLWKIQTDLKVFARAYRLKGFSFLFFFFTFTIKSPFNFGDFLKILTTFLTLAMTFLIEVILNSNFSSKSQKHIFVVSCQQTKICCRQSCWKKSCRHCRQLSTN